MERPPRLNYSKKKARIRAPHNVAALLSRQRRGAPRRVPPPKCRTAPARGRRRVRLAGGNQPTGLCAAVRDREKKRRDARAIKRLPRREHRPPRHRVSGTGSKIPTNHGRTPARSVVATPIAAAMSPCLYRSAIAGSMCGRFGRKSRLQGRRHGQAYFLWRKPPTAIFEGRTKLSEAEAKSFERPSANPTHRGSTCVVG
jgi:hypothetical protein